MQGKNLRIIFLRGKPNSLRCFRQTGGSVFTVSSSFLFRLRQRQMNRKWWKDPGKTVSSPHRAERVVLLPLSEKRSLEGRRRGRGGGRATGQLRAAGGGLSAGRPGGGERACPAWGTSARHSLPEPHASFKWEREKRPARVPAGPSALAEKALGEGPGPRTRSLSHSVRNTTWRPEAQGRQT